MGDKKGNDTSSDSSDGNDFDYKNPELMLGNQNFFDQVYKKPKPKTSESYGSV